MSIIKNTELAYEYALEVKESLKNFTENTLGSVDDSSTISANEVGKKIFTEVQKTAGQLKGNLQKEVSNMMELKTKYCEFDEAAGEKNKG